MVNSVQRIHTHTWQVRDVPSMMRKEKRVRISIFSFIVDSALQNAYKLYETICQVELETVRDFNLRVMEILVTPYIDRISEGVNLRRLLTYASTFKQTNDEPNLLLTNIAESSSLNIARQCYLCKHLSSVPKKTYIYSFSKSTSAFM